MSDPFPTRPLRPPPTLHFGDQDPLPLQIADRELVAYIPRPAIAEECDGADLVTGGHPSIDAQRRIACSRVAQSLGWPPQAVLWAQIRERVVVVTTSSTALAVRIRLDGHRRLTLTPAILRALDVRPHDRVQLVASRPPEPDTPTLFLLPPREALRLLSKHLLDPLATGPAGLADPGS